MKNHSDPLAKVIHFLNTLTALVDELNALLAIAGREEEDSTLRLAAKIFGAPPAKGISEFMINSAGQLNVRGHLFSITQIEGLTDFVTEARAYHLPDKKERQALMIWSGKGVE